MRRLFRNFSRRWSPTRCLGMQEFRAGVGPSQCSCHCCATNTNSVPIRCPGPRPSPGFVAWPTDHNDKWPTQNLRSKPRSTLGRCRPTGPACKGPNSLRVKRGVAKPGHTHLSHTKCPWETRLCESSRSRRPLPACRWIRERQLTLQAPEDRVARTQTLSLRRPLLFHPHGFRGAEVLVCWPLDPSRRNHKRQTKSGWKEQVSSKGVSWSGVE